MPTTFCDREDPRRSVGIYCQYNYDECVYTNAAALRANAFTISARSQPVRLNRESMALISNYFRCQSYRGNVKRSRQLLVYGTVGICTSSMCVDRSAAIAKCNISIAIARLCWHIVRRATRSFALIDSFVDHRFVSNLCIRSKRLLMYTIAPSLGAHYRRHDRWSTFIAAYRTKTSDHDRFVILFATKTERESYIMII